VLRATFFLVILFLNAIYAYPQIDLTAQEKAFIKNHPTIILGTDKEWAPYVIQNEDGTVTGYDVSVLNLINKVSNANFTIHLDSWANIKSKAKKRKIDGLSTAVAHKSFKNDFLFSKPYIKLDKIIFTSKNNPINFNTLGDLEGKKFGVYESNILAEEIANKIPNIKIVKFDSTKKLIEGVTTGKVDAMLGNAAMFYLLNKMSNPFLKPSIFLHDKPLELVFVIRNDFPEAVSIINKSLRFIGEEKLLNLKRRWFENPNNLPSNTMSNLTFTKKEREYIKNKKQITLCVDPNGMPFEKLENGNYIGMAAEYVKIFQESLNIPFKVVKTNTWYQSLEFAKNRKCDILPFIIKTPNRKKYLNFTVPYFKTPMVLATKPNTSFVDDFSTIKDKKIGIVKGYASYEILKKEFPNLILVEVNDIEEGLHKVIDEELFGFIDTLAMIGYMFQTKFTGELKISGKIDNKWQLGVGVRNDDLTLLNILNKVIKNLPLQETQRILNNYIGIKYEKGFDYSLFWKIFTFFTILILVLLLRYRTINQYNKKIEKYLKMIDNNVLSSSSDKDGYITNISTALCRLTGYTKEELIGKNYNIFRHKDMPKSVFEDMWKTIKSGKSWQGEIKSLKKDGSSYWSEVKINPDCNKDGTLKGYTAVRQDITDKKMLEKLTITDTLTQIPNRLYLDNNYKTELERAKRYNSIFSVIIMDIDLFKDVNDTYGHQVGDIILIKIAKILQNNIRKTDILGRWGGEEFVIISPEVDAIQSEMFAKKIKEIIEYYDFPIVRSITCSFGISQYIPGDREEDTFKRADKALYMAKKSGRNRVIIA